jgi:thioesterase domain-containing protein
MHIAIERTLTAPATPMQESVWWAHQRAKNKSIYNITWRLACDRAIDFGALGIAWQEVVDRHEALRTTVARVGTAVELTAMPHVTAELDRVEVDDPGTIDVPTLLRLIAEESHARVMVLERAPLARLTLVRVGDQHELLLTVHHVALDGWALQLLVGELSTAYSAALERRQPSFGDEPTPFHVYADEISRARAEGHWEQGLDHWRTTLEGASAATVVADRQTKSVVGAAGEIIRYVFSDEAATGIRALSKAAFATSFTIVLGAMQIVLARGGAGSDVTVGVVAANRLSARDQNLVGYTANLCISRATVNDDDSIADVVARARDGVWTMLAHQAVPYPVVFAALSPATQATLSDASPMMLSFLGPIARGLRLGDVELTFVSSPNRAARADMAVGFWDIDDGHLAEIEFNTARYDPDTVMRLLHDIDTVLATGGADASRKVGSLEVRSRSMTRRDINPRPRSVSGSAGTSPVSVSSAPATQTAVESGSWECVAAAWAEVVGSPPSEPDVDFFAAGGNSLSLVRLAAALESDTGVTIDVVDWLSEPTPRRIMAQLAGDGVDGARPASTTLTWVRDGTGPHLHLLPGAGGGVHDFRDLIAALPSDWRVTASQEREPLPTVPMMARRCHADLHAAELRPDILAGWSMGGQIAYEMALGYETPAPALVVLDATPPVGGAITADLDEQRASVFAATVCRSLDVELRCSLPRTHGDDELRMGVLAAYLACAGQQVSATVLGERWRTYRRHTTASMTYVRSGQVDARGLIVGADLLDSQVDQWAERFAGKARKLRVDADHHGLLIGAVAEQIAAAIGALELGRVAGSRSGALGEDR